MAMRYSEACKNKSWSPDFSTSAFKFVADKAAGFLRFPILLPVMGDRYSRTACSLSTKGFSFAPPQKLKEWGGKHLWG
jgi:hypothetical protein